MDLIRITALVAIAACSRPPTGYVRQPIDLGTPWTMHTIVVGASTGQHIGADGVDFHAGVAVVPWEQGNAVSTTVLSTGTTTTIAMSQSGPEDARLCDLDGDGTDDIVVAGSGNSRVWVVYGGTSTPVTITASQSHARWIQVGCGDIDGDGKPDIVGGSYAGTSSVPAVIGVLYNPGSRSGTSWTYERVTYAGWTMSVIPVDMDGDGDLDLVVTDRAGYKLPGDTVPRSDLQGTRWEEHSSGTWTNRAILAAPYTGDEMFGRVYDVNADGHLDVIEGRSHASQSSTIAVHYGPAFTSSTTLYTDTETGRHYQGLDIGDIDQDGRDDLVVSTWESNACCSDTIVGVYWLHNNGDGTYSNGKVADGTGTKYDNVVLRDMDADGDLDIVDTEQINQQGLIWYENPLAPMPDIDGAPDAAIDAPHDACGGG